MAIERISFIQVPQDETLPKLDPKAPMNSSTYVTSMVAEDEEQMKV